MRNKDDNELVEELLKMVFVINRWRGISTTARRVGVFGLLAEDRDAISGCLRVEYIAECLELSQPSVRRAFRELRASKIVEASEIVRGQFWFLPLEGLQEAVDSEPQVQV